MISYQIIPQIQISDRQVRPKILIMLNITLNKYGKWVARWVIIMKRKTNLFSLFLKAKAMY